MIRDLQMECDCKSLEIMRVKIYMLIPKLVTLGNTVSEREKFCEIFEAGPLRTLPMAYCVAMEELVQAVRTHSSTLSLKTGLSKSPLRLWLCNLPGSSNQHNTGLLSSFKKTVTSQSSFEALKSDPVVIVEIQFFLIVLIFSLGYKIAC